MPYGVLVDLIRCIGCRACVAGCKMQNDLPMDNADHAAIQSERHDAYIPDVHHAHRPPLSAASFTVVECHQVSPDVNDPQWVYVKRQCMHCEHPACESACPVEALYKTAEGPVIYKKERCMGCRYCMMACPFAVPAYQWDKAIPYVKKCMFCRDRILNSDAHSRSEHLPACVASCPTNTLKFGERGELLTEAKHRIENNEGLYYPQVFGEHEVGGTSWLYLSPVPFTDLGFPPRLEDTPYPEYTLRALGSVPPLIVAGGSILAGLYILWKRRIELAQEREQHEGKGEWTND